MANDNPLKVSCRNCGAPVGFDIIKQSYQCTSCGEVSGIEEFQNRRHEWHRIRRDDIKNSAEKYSVAEYNCPSCAATVILGEEDVSATCAFCGTKFVRSEFVHSEKLPEMIIPFFITEQEAENRFLEWGRKNRFSKEGRNVLKNIDKMSGCYLPYRLVRGPVYGDVTRDASKRKYRCSGYIEGTAVNTSKQFSNALLDEMEPFDWNAVKDFEFAYITDSRIKLEDVSGEEVSARTVAEIKHDFLPDVEKAMQTTGLYIDLNGAALETMYIALPVYFIKGEDGTAVMNGQTGRIAASVKKERKTYPWVIEPALLTILLTAALSAPYHFNPEAIFLFGAVFSCIIFAAMGEGRSSLIRSIYKRTQVSRSTREKAKLKIEEGKDVLKNPYENKPVFLEKNEEGMDVPVKIRFYTFGRWLRITLKMIMLIFIPVIIAAPIRMIMVHGNFAAFFEKFRPQYGAAWYVIAFFVVLIYWITGVRNDAYNHPILYEILPNGKKRLMGTFASRGLGLLGIFNDGQKVGVKAFVEFMKDDGAAALLILGFPLLVIIGCVGAILS